MTDEYDVLIVGGGMVGSALGCCLGGGDLRVAIVEGVCPSAYRPNQEMDLRVSALSVSSQTVMETVGAWQGVMSRRYCPFKRMRVWETTGDAEFRADDIARPQLGHIVENRVTQKALWDRASRQPTVTFYSGAGIQSLADTGEQITATLDNGKTVTGRLLIGADGAGSRVRQLAGIGVSRDQYAQQALVASVRYRGTPADITWQAFQSSGPRAFLPLHSAGPAHPGESWASLVWYDDSAALSELKALTEQDFIARVRAGFPEELPDLTAVAARASFPIARQHAHTYFHDRVVLVGDAAHTINPLAGQGVNLGFQDARCLQALLDEARRQGQDPGNPQLLAQYEAERRPANRRMMLTMDAFYHLFSNRRTPLWAVRNLGLGLAQGLPFARNRVARYAMGIDEGLPLPARALLERLPSPWRAAG